MSENIAPDEVKRRLIIFLRIPNETWTDMLKLFTRRTLVQKISPVCYRLKEISDKSVKSIHVIVKANRFANKLKWDEPEANAQLEQLKANKCKLANQFRLTDIRITDKSKAILQHCLDLFEGCLITSEFKRKKHSNFMECLSILEPTKPILIYIDEHDVDPADKIWLHPTVRNCNRIGHIASGTNVKDIFDWLHQKPLEMNGDGSADGQVRCMIYSHHGDDLQHIIVLFNCCLENFEQSQSPADRRQFVLSFDCYFQSKEFAQFGRKENQKTGEVLMLDRVMETNQFGFDEYRLRRCLAHEVAAVGSEEFYAKMFEREDGSDCFSIDGNMAEVIIE